ncbi:DUF2863 family protein, partial [Klebsiella pneumoniae]|nr:DUF2863 family protein [Klebsiella pneumoniae]
MGAFCHPDNPAQVEEFRISFLARPGKDVVYGVVWPLYGEDMEDKDEPGPFIGATLNKSPSRNATGNPLQEILRALKELGIVHIDQLDDAF